MKGLVRIYRPAGSRTIWRRYNSIKVWQEGGGFSLSFSNPCLLCSLSLDSSSYPPFPAWGESWLQRADERSVQHNAHNRRQMCALRSMRSLPLSLSLSVSSSPSLFHSASPHPTPSLFLFRARYGNSTFIPPSLSLSLSFSRLSNIFNVRTWISGHSISIART